MAGTLSEGIVKINSKALEAAELKRLDKQEKEFIFMTHGSVKDIRVQLNDQLKCLDGRLEIQQGIVTEFQDVFRRRAEIELNYSKELEKLAKAITNRNKEHKQKRDGWQLFSSMGVWEQLVAETKRSSRDHSALAEICASHIVQRCTNINDDLQRMYKKCREIGYEIHEEVLKVLHELHTAMKTHHNYQSEFRQAENKLQVAEKQRSKLMQTVPIEKREKHKKFRLIEKEFQKRNQKYEDARMKATKARNEYMLCMDSANASIQKYFADDLSDLIDCMDFGFHQSLYRAVMMHSSGLDQIRRSLQVDIDSVGKSLGALDSRLDKQRFFEYNNAAFMIPKKFEYNPVRRDESETLVQKSILDELECRKSKLKERLTALRAESEEIWKSMETAERSLSDIVAANDFDTTRFFVEDDRTAHREPESIVQKQKMDRIDIEDFYTVKFREYVLNSNRMSRLQAKYDHIRVTLGDQASHPAEGNFTLTRRQNTSRRRIGRTPRQHGGQPKLFGGSLEEYLEETNQDIPTIIKSCVRLINLYGLHHHGIFRVSGSQVEINNFRDAFERGDDPLADMTDASDINSVAGVFKLYLRELREPIFPIIYFDQFMELAQLESKHEFVVKVRDLVKVWPRPIFIVMRYIFAFLNHLSEYSDENMMDPYNLAICFGPTLVPIPEDRDQVQYQNLVNELIKNFIIFHEDIFPTSIPGPVYEKYLTLEPDDMGDSPVENSVDDLESETTEDDSVFRESTEREDFRDLSLDLFGKSELLEAQALYDFSARSVREVNFSKGDTIILYKQVSNDWWKGSVNGKEGLIPDKYIMLKIRGEDDRERLESCRSIEDATSVRDRAGSTAFETRTRSRASSSSTDNPQSQPSPVNKRRSRPSSTSATTTSSGGGLGSNSSPISSPGSLRASRNSVASTRSVTSQHKRISPKSMSISGVSSPPSPPVTSTVITVTGRRASRDSSASSPTTATTGNNNDNNITSVRRNSTNNHEFQTVFKSQELTEQPLEQKSSSVLANTHIIRVSGPVTNLDDPAAASTTAFQPRERSSSEVFGPRSRMPVSPSMEKRLHEISASGGSQDSITSTGSNQELKTQLDSTIAEVEAIAEHLEKQKSSPPSESGSTERHQMLSETTPPSAAPKPTLRRVSSGGDSATPQPQPQPRPTPRTTKSDDSKSKQSPPPSQPQQPPKEDTTNRVFLRQSSWASREQIGDDDDNVTRRTSTSSLGANTPTNGGIFAKNRSLWERRTSQQNPVQVDDGASGNDDNGNAVRGGFRSNRDFWEQRVTMRQKQTPDLVLDLPVSTLSTSPGAPAITMTTDASPTGATPAMVVPIPKPRPRPSVDNARSPQDGNRLGTSPKNGGNSSSDENVTDQFAKSDRNTLKKLRQQQQQQQQENEGDAAAEIVAVRRNVIQAKGRVTPKNVSPPAADRTQK